MNNEFISYIIYLIIAWYLLDWIITFSVYGNKKNEKYKDQNFKEYNIARHIVCGIVLVIFLINLFKLN